MMPHAHSPDDDLEPEDTLAMPALPPLPLARPGERAAKSGRATSSTSEPASAVGATPRKLGGSSLTAAVDRRAAPPRADELQRREIAAQLASGMLANPGRSQASVKDAMALYDHLLEELRLYERVSAGIADVGPDTEHAAPQAPAAMHAHDAAPAAMHPMPQTPSPTAAALPPEPIAGSVLGTSIEPAIVAPVDGARTKVAPPMQPRPNADGPALPYRPSSDADAAA